MIKWDYYIDNRMAGHEKDKQEERLKFLGSQGWELVQISSSWLIFKRPRTTNQ